jgi:CheY-like chemotaxis protein
VFDSLWRRAPRAVLLVSETPAAPLFDADFLHQPHIRLLEAVPDENALDLAAREQPSLILEHLDVPGEAGLELCHELADHAGTRSIPVILVVPGVLWDRARKTGAEVVLEKPVERQQLFDAVRRFVPLPRRRADRLQINLRFTYHLDGRVSQAFSRDLSPRGAFLKSDRLPPLGARLELRFCIPGLADEVRCDGVVRTTSAAIHPASSGGIGIEFEGLSDADRRLLANFLGQHR